MDKIVSHDTQKQSYLTKWKDLSLTYASWEKVDQCQADNFTDHVEKYKALISSVSRQNIFKPYKTKRLGPTELLKVKNKHSTTDFDEQPDWIPKDLKLYPYQLNALKWLSFSWCQSRNVLLADEMGLGKTIQAIAFIRTTVQFTGQRGPFLIICPLSTCENWKRELELWAPDLYTVLYHGMEDERKLLRVGFDIFH